MAPLGSHDLLKYDGIELRVKERKILRGEGITVKAVNIVRLRYPDGEVMTPVVLVTAPEGTGRDRAQRAVDKVKRLMVRAGMPDVECEIKGGVFKVANVPPRLTIEDDGKDSKEYEDEVRRSHVSTFCAGAGRGRSSRPNDLYAQSPPRCGQSIGGVEAETAGTLLNMWQSEACFMPKYGKQSG